MPDETQKGAVIRFSLIDQFVWLILVEYIYIYIYVIASFPVAGNNRVAHLG